MVRAGGRSLIGYLARRDQLAAHGHHLGQHRQGDFRRRVAADADPRRRVQTVDLLHRQVEQAETDAALGAGARRTERTDVERVLLERF